MAPEILALAGPAARFEPVGKRAGRAGAAQLRINQRLIELAQAGLRVLRLKGGDPFVFGRGGEEALALAAAGVPFRVVPGITAGIGGLAYAGIPLDPPHAVALGRARHRPRRRQRRAARPRLGCARPRPAHHRPVHGARAPGGDRRSPDDGRP